MEPLFLIILVVAVAAWALWDRWQMKNSPYYRTLAEIRRRLDFAEFSGQSLEAQEWQAYTAPESTLPEAGFARYLRMDIVQARLAMDDLRALSDQRGENGYESVDHPVGEVLVAP